MQSNFSKLDFLHSSLIFIHKKEINKSLSFLNVLVEKSNKKFITSVYRKFTFTGQYIRWDSFGPKKRKTNFIGTLVHRALKICSPKKFSSEIELETGAF